MRSIESTQKSNYPKQEINVMVEGGKVGFTIHHIGLEETKSEAMVTIDEQVLAKLIQEFNLPSRNPDILKTNTQIFLDYRHLPRKVLDLVSREFPEIAVSYFAQLFGVNETGHTEGNRYVYLSLKSKIRAFFEGGLKKRLERKFRHELQHLAHTKKFLHETGDTKKRLVAFLVSISGGATAGFGIVNFSETQNIDFQSAGLVLIGIAMVGTAYDLYSKALPSEVEAIAAEHKLQDALVFKFSE